MVCLFMGCVSPPRDGHYIESACELRYSVAGVGDIYVAVQACDGTR